MRFAISNIAWAPAQDEEVAAEMRAAGAFGVEIAPTAVWTDPLRATPSERRAYAEQWRARGLPIVALQSLVFGRPDLQLFGEATRVELKERLLGLLEVARDLEVGPLVFGSPRNRARRALCPEAALDIAVPFFRDVGDAAARLGVFLCIEPNPPAYGCDFVTTAAEGRALVEAVGSPGFRLHLDTAAMLLAGDSALAEIPPSIPVLGHVHLSAPALGPVRPSAGVDYPGVMETLRTAGYAGVASIEMRAAADPGTSLANARAALRFVGFLASSERG